MQLLINISKEIYERTLPYKDSPIVSNLTNDYPELTHAVANGTPLPKGHGDLIDVDELLDRIELEDNDSNRKDNVGEIITLEDFDSIPTIIEADKG